MSAEFELKQEHIIRHCINEGYAHVFIIANQINAIIARMLIEHYQISFDKVILVSHREADTSLVGIADIYTQVTLNDRLLMKLFSISGPGIKVRRYLEKHRLPYIVYTSWMYPEAEAIVASSMCQGYVYIEEGQQTYYQASTYDAKNNPWSSRKTKILNGSVDHYFADTYSACVGLSKESFPLLDESRKIILSNFEDAKKLYKPVLIGCRDIGITPAPRRIPEEFLPHLAKTLVEELPDGGVIKLHPGFNIHTNMRDTLVSYVNKYSKGQVSCCPDNAIIELEMMYESKVLIGQRSSVDRYAKQLGSEYRIVDFEGYLAPKN